MDGAAVNQQLKEVEKFGLLARQELRLLLGKSSENEILKRDFRRLTRADSDAEPSKFVSDVTNYIGDSVVTPGASLERNLEPSQLDINLVVDDNKRTLRIDAVIVADRAD